MPIGSKNTLMLNKPELFVPAFSHGTANNSLGSSVSFTEVSDTNIESTSSFRYDLPGSGLRSTQQIGLDWSKFENHTFFNSAEVNVNVAFERIINEYPFDGTKREIEAFFDGLTGFEKWVYDSFPKNRGFLFFSGAVGPDGTHIVVDDYAGASVTTLASNKSGRGVLDPGGSSFRAEMHLFVPVSQSVEPTTNQIVLQKLSGSSQGFTLAVQSSLNTSTSASLLFTVASGSAYLNASATIDKGQFNHIAAAFDRRGEANKLALHVNDVLQGTSEVTFDVGQFDFVTSPLTIGSGSAYLTSSAATVTPTMTLSGALDELRFWHRVRTDAERKNFARKSVFTDDDLRLYLKFNEPSGTLGATEADRFNRVVLDSSGNSLHSFINEAGFQFSLRSTGSLTNPMTNEKHELSPVLFPNFTGVTDLNTLLLTTASLYDQVNPNLITKLVPAHYFQEGRVVEGLDETDGTVGDAPSNTSLPGTVTLGSAQLLSTLLYVYAKQFDEMKVMLDSFSNVLRVGYEKEGTTPDSFLPLIAEFYGFKLPGFFSDAAISQFIDAENLDHEISTGTVSLRYVQNQIMRRILSSLREIISSKGTMHSVKSFFRAMGVDPDNSMRMREFGGPSMATLAMLRERKTDTSTMLSMTASNAALVSPYLSGAKVEPELSFPPSKSAHVKSTVTVAQPGGRVDTLETLVSPSPDDGLFTSGSWACEAVYRFPVDVARSSVTQSLMRMCTTGSSLAANPGLIANLIAISSSVSPDDTRIVLYARPGTETTALQSPMLAMELTGANVFDGEKWHVSFGRYRNDEIGSDLSSSYFMRAERRDLGSHVNIGSTS